MTRQITPLPRFDGAAAWAVLTPGQQAEIGAIALEIVINNHGEDTYFSGLDAQPEARPFIAAAPLLADHLMAAANDALHSRVLSALDDYQIPIPSLLGPVCRVCRCSQEDACDEGCGWAEPDLCTACVIPSLAPAAHPPSETARRHAEKPYDADLPLELANRRGS